MMATTAPPRSTGTKPPRSTGTTGTAKTTPPPNAEYVGNPRTPPRSVPDPAKETPASPPRAGKYVDTFEALYGGLGLICLKWAPNTAAAMFEEITFNDEDEEPQSRAHHCAVAWDEYAQTSPGLRKFLDKMGGMSPIMKLGVLHAPLMANAAAELGLFNQIGKLFKKKEPKGAYEPPTTAYYGANGHQVNPEFGATAV